MLTKTVLTDLPANRHPHDWLVPALPFNRLINLKIRAIRADAANTVDLYNGCLADVKVLSKKTGS